MCKFAINTQAPDKHINLAPKSQVVIHNCSLQLIRNTQFQSMRSVDSVNTAASR